MLAAIQIAATVHTSLWDIQGNVSFPVGFKSEGREKHEFHHGSANLRDIDQMRARGAD